MGPEVRALGYLLRRQGANGLLDLARNFWRPRYLVGILGVVGYFAFLAHVIRTDEGLQALPQSALGDVLPLAVLAVALFLGLTWLLGGKHGVLAFTPGEVQLLFPAPLSRRTLLNWRLVRAQRGLLLGSLLFTLILSDAVPVAPPLRFVSLWVGMNVILLHSLGASLAVTALGTAGPWRRGRGPESAPPGAGRPRAALPVALAGIWFAVIAWGVGRAIVDIRTGAVAGSLASVLGERMSRGALGWALYPLDVVLSPLVAGTPGAWLLWTSGALGVLVLHYLWVVGVDHRFEETAARVGDDASALNEAVREGRLTAYRMARSGRTPRAPFSLAASGPPAMAVFWKNLTAITRTVTPRTVVIAASGPLAVGGLIWMDDGLESAAGAVAFILILVAGVLAVAGPLAVRNDFRTDLLRGERVRTFPLGGFEMAVAQVGASTLSLWLLHLLVLIPAGTLLALSGLDLPAPWMLPAGLALALLTLLLGDFAGQALQNVAAVGFPQWYQLGPRRADGIEGLGSGLLLTVGTGILTGAAYLVPLGVGAGAGFLGFRALGWWGAALGFPAAWVLLLAEGGILLAVLAELWENLDLSETRLLQ